MKNVCFIGYGKIAHALAKGLIRSQQYKIRASSPSLKKRTDELGVETNPDNLAFITDASIIILAVKPALMSKVLTEIQDLIPNDCLLISVATGLTLSWFKDHTPPSTAVVRVMPNIAASIGESATPIIANSYVNASQKNDAMNIVNSIGICTWLQNESDIEIFTALSGSGPAYVFQFLQSMIDAAINMGLDENIAKTFALQTFSGAVALATNSGKSLAILRDEVTSPGGTTAAALDVFKNLKFNELVNEAMKAARNRAQELSKI